MNTEKTSMPSNILDKDMMDCAKFARNLIAWALLVDASEELVSSIWEYGRVSIS